MTNKSWEISLCNLYSNNKKITFEEYEDFKKTSILYILQDKRYGQAFCEHFDIEGSPLYFFKDSNLCEKWIKDNHL